MVGGWLTTPESLESMRTDLVDRVAAAGPAGLDVAAFDDRERAVLGTLDAVVVDATTARLADVADPYADHPYLEALLAGGFAPPPPDAVDRGRTPRADPSGPRGRSRRAATSTRPRSPRPALVAAELLVANPDGFTVAQFRDATGASRKFALPLVSELDAQGVTRRRDDVRIAGPRLPR